MDTKMNDILIGEVRKKLQEAESDLRKLQDRIQAYKNLLRVEGYFEITQEKATPHDYTDKKTIADMAVDILREVGHSMHYTDIMENIYKMGGEIPGKNPKANMTAHLSNDPRIARADKRGFYGLKEWEQNGNTLFPESSQGGNKNAETTI